MGEKGADVPFPVGELSRRLPRQLWPLPRADSEEGSIVIEQFQRRWFLWRGGRRVRRGTKYHRRSSRCSTGSEPAILSYYTHRSVSIQAASLRPVQPGMSILAWCKTTICAGLRWNALAKSFFVSVLVGSALTYVNHGRMMSDAIWPPWWKIVLNFVIPFAAEMLLCVVMDSCCRSSEVTEVILHEIKQDQHAVSAMPEIAVYSGIVEHSKDVKLTTIGTDPEFCEDIAQHSRRSWPAPEASDSPTEDGRYVHTRANSLGLFSVDEIMASQDYCAESPIRIRPLPKESARRPLRNKSLGCISDLHGRQRIRIANAERLHVFNNGLYAGDSPPAYGTQE